MQTNYNVLLQLATNALTAVATSGAQGNAEEEFAGSNRDE
jgi:hypothetical protein